MPFTESPYDGASLYYRLYVPQTSAASFRYDPSGKSSQPKLVFTAAWPFSSRMYDHLVPILSESHRYPCLLTDRRGYGQSEWSGPQAFQKHDISYDTFAQDLHHIFDLHSKENDDGFVGIGTSMGCGELIHTLLADQSGALLASCRGLIFICPSLPVPLWTERKPVGPKRDFWDAALDDLRADPDEGLIKTMPVIFGSYLPSMPAQQKTRYEQMMSAADKVAVERTVQIFLEHDFTDELKLLGERLKVPVLILHGSEDRANPADIHPVIVRDALPTSQLKVYEGGGHALYQTHYDEFMKDVLEFLSELPKS